MPGKQRIGCHERPELNKSPTTKDLGLHGQSYPLFVGESQSLSFELLFENTILFYQIVDDRLLVAFKPVGQGNYGGGERVTKVCIG